MTEICGFHAFAVPPPIEHGLPRMTDERLFLGSDIDFNDGATVADLSPYSSRAPHICIEGSIHVTNWLGIGGHEANDHKGPQVHGLPAASGDIRGA